MGRIEYLNNKIIPFTNNLNIEILLKIIDNNISPLQHICLMNFKFDTLDIKNWINNKKYINIFRNVIFEYKSNIYNNSISHYIINKYYSYSYYDHIDRFQILICKIGYCNDFVHINISNSIIMNNKLEFDMCLIYKDYIDHNLNLIINKQVFGKLIVYIGQSNEDIKRQVIDCILKYKF